MTIYEHATELPSWHDYCEYFRRQLGYSTQDFCTTIGVSRGTYYIWRKQPNTTPQRRTRLAVENLAGQTWRDFCISPNVSGTQIFSEVLRDSGLSVEQLAHIAGVSVANLHKWLTGELSPGLESLVLIIEALARHIPQTRGRIYETIHNKVLRSL